MSKLGLEDIACIVPCIECDSIGNFMKYPHYADPMPEKEEVKCKECNGHGIKILVASGVGIVRDTSFKIRRVV